MNINDLRTPTALSCHMQRKPLFLTDPSTGLPLLTQIPNAADLHPNPRAPAKEVCTTTDQWWKMYNRCRGADISCPGLAEVREIAAGNGNNATAVPQTGANFRRFASSR